MFTGSIYDENYPGSLYVKPLALLVGPSSRRRRPRHRRRRRHDLGSLPSFHLCSPSVRPPVRPLFVLLRISFDRLAPPRKEVLENSVFARPSTPHSSIFCQFECSTASYADVERAARERLGSAREREKGRFVEEETTFYTAKAKVGKKEGRLPS